MSSSHATTELSTDSVARICVLLVGVNVTTVACPSAACMVSIGSGSSKLAAKSIVTGHELPSLSNSGMNADLAMLN